jgi:transposase InsO family protein
MLKVAKRWHSKCKLAVFVHDNSGENKSKEIMEFFASVGVLIHLSIPEEQWQNGAAESTFNSIL